MGRLYFLVVTWLVLSTENGSGCVGCNPGFERGTEKVLIKARRRVLLGETQLECTTSFPLCNTRSSNDSVYGGIGVTHFT